MIDPSTIRFVGYGLNRPECVLAHASGHLFAADWDGNGGVAIIGPDGAVRRVTARDVAEPLRPNGVALEDGGTFLVTHLAPKAGGVFRLHPDGRTEPVLCEIDGQPIPPTNFVLIDRVGRLWVTVSTRKVPRDGAARPDVADGFIVLIPHGGTPRIVADDLGYTNECVVSADGASLYVNETFGKRLSRFEITGDSLGPRETVVQFGEGTFPDGLAPDVHGGLWLTSIVSNRVIRVAPDGTVTTLLEDSEPAAVAETDAMFVAGRLDRPRLDFRHGRVLANTSSLAFGGDDRRTGYLGCLKGDRIAVIDMPVAGAAPVHWNADLTKLAQAGLLSEPK